MANLITLLRFILIPFFAYFILSSMNIAALAVFVLAALTDWFDGYVARRTKITQFGKVADPVADRLLVIVAAVLLTVKGMLPFPAMALIVLREFIVAGGAAILQINGVQMEVITAGKYATAALFIAFVLILLRVPYSWLLMYVAALFYLAVAGIYTFKIIKILVNRGV